MELNAVVCRELEGCEFFALILRPHQSDRSADVMYADDGNMERDVPFEELRLVTEPGKIREVLTDENRALLRQCLETLRAEEAELVRAAAKVGGAAPTRLLSTSGATAEDSDQDPASQGGGVIVCPDGTRILCHGQEDNKQRRPAPPAGLRKTEDVGAVDGGSRGGLGGYSSPSDSKRRSLAEPGEEQEEQHPPHKTYPQVVAPPAPPPRGSPGAAFRRPARPVGTPQQSGSMGFRGRRSQFGGCGGEAKAQTAVGLAR